MLVNNIAWLGLSFATISTTTAQSPSSRCGGTPYSVSQYTCYDGFLCPLVAGERTLKCGNGCYLPEAYSCTDNKLKPHPSTTRNFELFAKNTISQLEGKQIQACGFSFNVGGDACTYCPEVAGSACSSTLNTTILAGGGAMDVIVPGGQQTFVLPNGAPSYTQAHSTYIPSGSTIGSLVGYQQGYFAFVNESSHGWIACPRQNAASSPTIFQVFANITGQSYNKTCVPLNIVTQSVPQGQYGAWQYT